ncbi:MAG: hypothetical protein QM530_05390 [Phycisphaerales bacterium]|nr:hypothetical protein [Phycisphaerales bacterium]
MKSISTIASLSMTQSLQKSWDTMKANIWLLAGFTVLFYLLYFVLSFIPRISTLAGFFSFAFAACIYSAYNGYEKNKNLEFNQFFSWSPRFGRLFLGNLLLLGLGMLILIPLIVILIAIVGFSYFIDLFKNADFFKDPENVRSFLVPEVLLFALVIFVIIVTIAIALFAYSFLLQFTDMPFMTALKTSWKIGRNNVGQIIIFALIATGLSILGTMALLIGLAVTTPLLVGIQYHFLNSMMPQIESETEQWDFMKQDAE